MLSSCPHLSIRLVGLRAEAVQLEWQWREEVPSFLVGEGVRHNGYFNRPSLLGVEGLIPERALPDFNDGILCKKGMDGSCLDLQTTITIYRTYY